MNPNSQSHDDILFRDYGRLLNLAYPEFLKRLGLDSHAVSAEGATIRDSKGRQYIDCINGYGLFNLGHNHPVIIKALQDQLGKKQLSTKPFITTEIVEAAKGLESILPHDINSIFFCNSGSEAIESALKLSRLQTGKKLIISCHNSFHGYTFGALSASGIPSFKKKFEPLLQGFKQVPFGDIDSLKTTVDERTAAILLEPVQHEAGIRLPPADYLKSVRSICDEYGILLILDEIKTGLGKTGRMFAFEHYEIVPDVIVLGKSLGGGIMPVGALCVKSNYWGKFGLSFPMSASSYSGNTLTCRAVKETVQIIKNEDIVKECARKGKIFKKSLADIANAYKNIVKNVNGVGLFIGVTTYSSRIAFKLVKKLIEYEILAIPCFGDSSTVIFEPPLVITEEQLNQVVLAFEKSCLELNN